MTAETKKPWSDIEEGIAGSAELRGLVEDEEANVASPQPNPWLDKERFVQLLHCEVDASTFDPMPSGAVLRQIREAMEAPLELWSRWIHIEVFDLRAIEEGAKVLGVEVLEPPEHTLRGTSAVYRACFDWAVENGRLDAGLIDKDTSS
jgi:hypothetical protein